MSCQQAQELGPGGEWGLTLPESRRTTVDTCGSAARRGTELGCLHPHNLGPSLRLLGPGTNSGHAACPESLKAGRGSAAVSQPRRTSARPRGRGSDAQSLMGAPTCTSFPSPRRSVSIWFFTFRDSLLTFRQTPMTDRRPQLRGSLLPQLLSSVFCSDLTCFSNRHVVCAHPCDLKETEPGPSQVPELGPRVICVSHPAAEEDKARGNEPPGSTAQDSGALGLV